MKIKYAGVALALAFCASTSAFAAQVQFVFNYVDAPGTGFNDAVLGGDRRAVMEAAGQYWSNLLVAKTPGETFRIDVDMNAASTSLNPLSSTSAPSFYSFTSAVPGALQQTSYTAALAEQLSGVNPNGLNADFKLTFSSTPAMTSSVYLGLDGNPGANQFDFLTYAERGIVRALGFNTKIDRALDASDGTQQGGFQKQYDGVVGGQAPMPSIYDRFLAERQADNTFVALTSMTDSQRVAAVTGTNLYWTGANAAAANGGNYVKLNSMPLNSDGTINGNVIVYTDPTVGNLMSYGSPAKGVAMGADAITLGQLQDMGWTISPVPEPSNIAMLLAGLGLIGVTVRRRLS
ncbi:PEP-CTERM sorting domain-containing protein [Uliginosibacterium sp. H3]|uniref:PEP-CTERM sorting domain-containing protein n=1 Tax=Uliginosibacterium silvisoli TaxID=3114758 RepID=A0ABU6K4P7_9RHOO|nr:PEP-CTERM sorting domain-containing protein [Uliginosibacterium sp. H3]